MPDKKIISLDELSRFKTNCDSEYQKTLVSGTNIKTINNTTLLGSGDYEFDSALSEISTNAIQNKVVSKEFAEVNYELAVIREELFETILTEIDYQVDYGYTYAIPDTLSDTEGTHRVVFSETALKTIEFNSVVMNQKMNLANLTFANLTKTTITDGYLYTCNINTSAANIYSIQTPKFTSNHKMLLILDVKSSKTISFTIAEFGSSYKYYSLTANQRRVIYDIQSALGNYNYIFPLGVSGNIAIGDTIEIYNFLFIDLTQMFGAGNEPTTTSDIRIQWLLSFGYIAYNTGSLLSTTTTGIQVKDSSNNVLGTISVPETSGKSAGNAHDYIEVVEGNIVEGEQLYNLVLHKLVDGVNLSDLEFTKGSSNRYISNDLQNSSKYYAYNVKPNAVCDNLEISTPDDVRLNTKEKIISINDTGTLVVYISSSYYSNNSAEQFLSDYGNTKLNYELATQTQTTISTDLQFDQISSLIQQGGNINALFTNVPPNVTTTFVVKKAVGE